MNNDQVKVMMERLEQIQRVCNRIDADLAHDRETIQHFSIRLGNLETQQAELWRIVNTLPQKTQQQLNDAVNSMVNETHDLKQTIDQKRFIAIDMAKAKKSFWGWLLFWKKKR